jgi:bifunctional N-acetylglucosamine-1-phosphate-uridyltransferase/glucosamine-1-phosphate-acetyltransferase GlmU-like protein
MKSFGTYRDIGPANSCRIYHSSSTTVTDTVTTTVNFDSERFDSSDMHDTSTNNERITIKSPGKYLLSANVSWAASAGGIQTLAIQEVGGNIIASNTEIGTTLNITSVATIWDCEVNDEFYITAFSNTGSNTTISSTSNYSPEFSAILLGT